MAEYAMASGPPYLPKTAALGGSPVPSIDDPICAVLLVFFVTGAVTNMTILQVNRRRGHKFLMSAMAFGFCMARTVAVTMRIVWASRPTDISVAIASQILTLAGVVLLFLINLIFTQRLVRAFRPRLGWSLPVTLAFRFLFASVPGVLIVVIPPTVYSFYTLNHHTLTIVRHIQLFATTYMAVLAFVPIPVTLLTVFAPPRPPHHGTVEAFGKGRLHSKVFLLLFTATLLALGASFRAGTTYAERPIDDPAWYDGRAPYYCFNYVIEIIVVYTYVLSRFDKRFHIPNGSSAPGHYSAGHTIAVDTEKGQAVTADSGESAEAAAADADAAPLARKTTLADRINDESDVFFPSDTDQPDASTRASTHAREHHSKEDDEGSAAGN